MSTTLHHSGSAADLCRERGWTVGTRLVGDEGYGPTVIEITAVGGTDILAKTLAHNGIAIGDRNDAPWELWCRDWRVATADEIPAPFLVGHRVVACDPPKLHGVVTKGPNHYGEYVVEAHDNGQQWVVAGRVIRRDGGGT